LITAYLVSSVQQVKCNTPAERIAVEAHFFGAPHSLSVLRKRIFCLERRTKSGRQAHVAKLAEHILGKNEVSSSRLLVGSREILDSVCIDKPKEAIINSQT